MSKGRFNVLSNCKPVETGSGFSSDVPRRERRGYAKPANAALRGSLVGMTTGYSEDTE